MLIQTLLVLHRAAVASINAIYFYNAEEGFAACNNQTLYLTQDSAANWQSLTGLPQIPHLLHFFDRSRGYLMTRTGTQEEVWETVDGGLNWSSKFGPNDNHDWEIYRQIMVIVENQIIVIKIPSSITPKTQVLHGHPNQ